LIDNQTKNPHIDINLNKRNNIFIIKFSDNAGGIPEEALAKIFDKSFSTKGEQGTGLGLYMSKMIVEKHFKGSIDVHNEKDGASFIINLPT